VVDRASVAHAGGAGTSAYVNERGFTLVETLVATAIAAIALAGIFFAFEGASRFGTQQGSKLRAGAALLAEQTLRTASNSWKYAAPGSSAPQLNGTWTTGPYTVDVATSELSTPAPNDPTRESATIRVTVGYTPVDDRRDSGNVSAETTVRVKAPLPGSTIDSGTTVTPPPGAP